MNKRQWRTAFLFSVLIFVVYLVAVILFAQFCASLAFYMVVWTEQPEVCSWLYRTGGWLDSLGWLALLAILFAAVAAIAFYKYRKAKN